MSSVDELIATLASEPSPVTPLKPPLLRALLWLACIGLLSGLAVFALGDFNHLLARYAGSETLMAWEMAAMLATGALAVTAAFFAAVPGRSPHWPLAPIVPFALWISVSGAGCYHLLQQTGSASLQLGHSMDCLAFILLVSLALGVPLIWQIARARPIEPIRVAVLGGLGSAAFAAFILQFFHPFAVTFVDLAAHLLAVALVVAAASALNRRALSPA